MRTFAHDAGAVLFLVTLYGYSFCDSFLKHAFVFCELCLYTIVHHEKVSKR